MIKFKLAPHTFIPGRPMLEILDDDELIACVYLNDSSDLIKVVSKYITDVAYDETQPKMATVKLQR